MQAQNLITCLVVQVMILSKIHLAMICYVETKVMTSLLAHGVWIFSSEIKDKITSYLVKTLQKYLRVRIMTLYWAA